MKNTISLSVENIKRIVRLKELTKYYDWDGDMDGEKLERFLDEAIPTHIRLYHDSDDNVVMIDKKLLDEAIDNYPKTKIDEILQRMLTRVLVDFYSTDYIDWYWKVLDPIYLPITEDETDWVYVKIYDYILERIADNYPVEYLKIQLQCKIFTYKKWEVTSDKDYTKLIWELKEILKLTEGMKCN
jgi:hypothetical protein